MCHIAAWYISILRMTLLDMSWFGDSALPLQKRLDQAFLDFKAFCTRRKISCSQPPFSVKLVSGNQFWAIVVLSGVFCFSFSCMFWCNPSGCDQDCKTAQWDLDDRQSLQQPGYLGVASNCFARSTCASSWPKGSHDILGNDTWLIYLLSEPLWQVWIKMADVVSHSIGMLHQHPDVPRNSMARFMGMLERSGRFLPLGSPKVCGMGSARVTCMIPHTTL